MRLIRSAALLCAALAPAALLVGCDRNPTTAAYVGDQTVSTKQLQQATNAGYRDPNIASAYSLAAYRRQVLRQQIFQTLLRRQAEQAGVKSPDRGIERALVQQDQQVASNQSLTLGQWLVQRGVGSAQQAAYYRDQALAGEVAVRRGLVTVDRAGAVPASSEAAAAAIVAKLQRNEDSYPAVVRRAGGRPGAAPELVTADALSDLFGAQKAGQARSHTGFVAPAPGGQPGFYAVYVFTQAVPADRLSPAELTSAVVQSAGHLQAKVLQGAGRIRLNPRFGTWNAQQGTVRANQPAAAGPR